MTPQAAHPDDLLVVATLSERDYNHGFSERQVFPASLPGRARLRFQGSDRQVRTVWVTELASRQAGTGAILQVIHEHAEKLGQAVVYRQAADWEPEPPSLIATLKALQPASKQDQHVRGYRRAIDDAIAVIAEWFEETA